MDHQTLVGTDLRQFPHLRLATQGLYHNNVAGLNFIHEKIEEENIFIYCYNGLTVSALICALYMIKKGDISMDIIHDVMRSKNKNIHLDFDLSIF